MPRKTNKDHKAPFPTRPKPMLATKIDEPFNDEDWVYEVKWDGYRIIAQVKDRHASLFSRSLLNFTRNYRIVANELANIKKDAVLDGEVILLNEKGHPDFDALQNYNGQAQLIYYIFDILYLDGVNLLNNTLIQRKTILKDLLPDSPVLKYSDHFRDGIQLFEQVSELGLEGIVAKKKDSVYKPGERTKNWLKVPTEKRQEFVIGGWTESGSGRSFRSLIFGAYENGNLVSVGHAGLGFKEGEMKSILDKLKKIEIKKKPFADEVETETTPHWVKPQLVANFKFATWTKSGKIRKPAIFLGFRNDKNPTEVVREPSLPISEVVADIPKSKSKGRQSKNSRSEKRITSEESNWKKIDDRKITSKEVFDIQGNKVELVNIEKELWRNVTKADLIQYYHEMASYILPHLKDRPLSLHIKNIAPQVSGFYIKDMEGRQPSWADIYSTPRKHKKKGRRDMIDYLVCNNEATLLYLIDLGCIDINPWTSTTVSPLQPDYIVIDLDPSDDKFEKAIEAAKAAKQVFDHHKLVSFIKTSGKTGIHICLPCEGFQFSDARRLAEMLCSEVQELVPDITTTAVSINQRGDKLYLDPNQNDEADTIASAYSVRPYHLPTVSTPIEWKEVHKNLDPHSFTIHTIKERVKKKGDLFTGVLDKKNAAKNKKQLTLLLNM